jgi:hypothetical protein
MNVIDGEPTSSTNNSIAISSNMQYSIFNRLPQHHVEQNLNISHNACHIQTAKSQDETSTNPTRNELITVTLHLSASTMSSTTMENEVKNIVASPRTDLVRVMLIPISGLEQREKEMIQTARTLQIPTTRWNGSLLYSIYKQQLGMTQVEEHLDNSSTSNAVTTNCEKRRIVLHLYQDSDMKWSINNKSGSSTSLVLPTTSSSAWFGTCIHKNIDFDWIQAYYITGKIAIPSSARGYEILWLLEYFQLMYQPDQFHFANFATYTRVQLWSKYYCFLRPKLIDWVMNMIYEIQKQETEGNRQLQFPLIFGTTTSTETSLELGTERLLPLGDVTIPSVSNSQKKPKRSLADRAFKLFNSVSCIEQSMMQPTPKQKSSDEAHSQTTVPCPEEKTAIEIRNDFCRYLIYRLTIENDNLSTLTDRKNQKWNIQFPVRPVTAHYIVDDSSNPEETNATNSNSSSSSLQVANESVGTGTTPKKKSAHQRYMVAHRAVLVIDVQRIEPEIENSLRQQRVQGKGCRDKSDLTAPVDELVEEEIAKGRLEDLLKQVESRNSAITSKDERRVTINENLSFEKDTTLRFDESKSFESSPQPIPPTKHLDIDELNVPHDELNASTDTGNSSINAAIGIFPSSSNRKKKKPKPVFVLPERLLGGDSLNEQGPPQLSRMKLPIVKSSPINTPYINDGSQLPGPITIVRKGTFDNTVTSALTGPFYIDENGVLRDVFENCDPDSDEDYEGDEDTRAQARRHEWIQTSLLNRGIGERMETLLKADGETGTKTTTASFDPWDWLSGLNVCELSREVLKSVEQYANCVICDSSIVTKPTTDNGVVASSNLQATIPSVQHKMETTNTAEGDVIDPTDAGPNKTCISFANDVAADEQIMEGEPFDHMVRNVVPVLPIDECNRDGSFGSQGSKESPRGVQRFDSVSSTDKLTTQPSMANVIIDVSTLQPIPIIVQTPKAPEKKIRGIKGLFRRKRVDAIIPKKNETITK